MENKNIINMDDETKALAKAFVQTALSKGYNSSQMTQIIRQERNEKIAFEEGQETQEEQEFREQTEKFLQNNNVSQRQRLVLHYVEDKHEKTTNVILELICIGNKWFNNKIDIEKEHLIRETYKKLKSVSNLQTGKGMKIHKHTVEYGFDDLKKYCTTLKTMYWNKGLKEYLEKNKSRSGSAREVVLIMTWIITEKA